MGAYIGAVGANIQTVNLTRCLPGCTTSVHRLSARCVFTNTTADGALSRRRTAGGELHPGAGDRRGRAVTGIDPVKLADAT